MPKDSLKIFSSLAFFIFAGVILYLLTKDSDPLIPVQKAALGGDFTLNSAKGSVSLSDYSGDPVLIYFGYTSCPDICPTSLAVMRQAFNLLNDEERSRVHGIFISVDPDRDKLDHLASYTQFFSPKIVGVTGSKEEIDMVVAQYGAFYRFVELKESAMGYTVDHSSRIYLVDGTGKLATSVGHNSSPAVLADKIRNLL